MLIPRREKSGNRSIRLAECLPPPEPKEGEKPEDVAKRDLFVEERRILEEAGAVLVVKRVPGKMVDGWSRRLTRAQADMTRADVTFRKEHGLSEGQDPDSPEILLKAYESLFTDAYVELFGFEDVTSAKSAWEALLDFLPMLAIRVGSQVMAVQRAQRPES